MSSPTGTSTLSAFCVKCMMPVEVSEISDRCPRCRFDTVVDLGKRRVDSRGRIIPRRQCSCGDVVHSNGGWMKHRARHRRVNDGHCAITEEQLISLIRARNGIDRGDMESDPSLAEICRRGT